MLCLSLDDSLSQSSREEFLVGDGLRSQNGLLYVASGGEEPTKHDPRPSMARMLRVYARVLVNGQEWLIKSRNSVRAVVLDGYNDWQLENDDMVENLRSKAYVSSD